MTLGHPGIVKYFLGYPRTMEMWDIKVAEQTWDIQICSTIVLGMDVKVVEMFQVSRKLIYNLGQSMSWDKV